VCTPPPRKPPFQFFLLVSFQLVTAGAFLIAHRTNEAIPPSLHGFDIGGCLRLISCTWRTSRMHTFRTMSLTRVSGQTALRRSSLRNELSWVLR